MDYEKEVDTLPLVEDDRCDPQRSFTPPVSGRMFCSVKSILLAMPQRLLGESLARGMCEEIGYRVRLCPDAESLESAARTSEAALIVVTALHGTGRENLQKQLSRLAEVALGVPLVVLSDSADMQDFCFSLSCGARGHVPTTLGFDVAMEAMRFVIAGGVFVPADSFVKRESRSFGAVLGVRDGGLTNRQSAIVEGLRLGKPNKIIAHELRLSESTVKVHVHNIMRKLGARNRTEVVLRASGAGAGGRREAAPSPTQTGAEFNEPLWMNG